MEGQKQALFTPFCNADVKSISFFPCSVWEGEKKNLFILFYKVLLSSLSSLEWGGWVGCALLNCAAKLFPISWKCVRSPLLARKLDQGILHVGWFLKKKRKRYSLMFMRKMIKEGKKNVTLNQIDSGVYIINPFWLHNAYKFESPTYDVGDTFILHQLRLIR